MNSIKAQLQEKCNQYIAQKSALITRAMSDAKEAANNETKSTAGDKHETARAAMQFEQEKLSGQLIEIDRLHMIMQN